MWRPQLPYGDLRSGLGAPPPAEGFHPMRLPTKGSGPAALVVAVLALLVAISGSSYAAVMIGKGSVDSAALRNGAVTEPKIASKAVTAWKLDEGSVTRPKIHRGAVNSDKVADGSLRAADFAEGELPTGAGAQGPKGERGEAGPQGAKGEKGDPGASATGSAYTYYDNAAPNTIAIPIVMVGTAQNFSGMHFTKQGAGPDFLQSPGTGMTFTQAGTYRISYGLGIQTPLAQILVNTYATKGATGAPTDPQVPGSQVQEVYNDTFLGGHNLQRSFLVSVAAGETVTTYVEANLLGVIRTSQWVDVQKVS